MNGIEVNKITPNSKFDRCWLACLVVLLLGSGCSTTEPNDSDLAGADEETASSVQVGEQTVIEEPVIAPIPKPEDYPVAPFEGDALYQLLVAEVAGYRSQYDVSLEKYMIAARETQDPGVAARATRLALYLKQDDTALEAVEIWAEHEPGNIDAHRYAADLLLRKGRFEDAISHMEAIKNLGGLAKFDVFAYRTANLDARQRESLLAAIEEMLLRHPGDEELMFSHAVLLQQAGRNEEALSLANELLLISDNINVIVLKMSSLSALERIDESIEFMRLKTTDLPDNRRLRLILARLLFEQRDLPAAQEQYLLVLEKSPNDGEVLFALALIALEQKSDDEAQRYFERMVRWDRRAGEAHYYLGSIFERKSDAEAAIREYKQVGDGYEFIPAQARIASLLVNEGRWEEAREYLDRMRAQRPDHRQQLIMIEAQLLTERGMQEEVFAFLDEILAQDPENIDLLYFRGMTGQRFDRLDILESDLRKVIEVDPGNADALNALGYTLTDQTDRHDEALALIEKALTIKPDEAAFIDSMGWVQYRLHNYEQAIAHLKRALTLFENDEVAAHLGEVLWVTGDHAGANQVWEKALELAPDSEILKGVIKRFREQ